MAFSGHRLLHSAHGLCQAHVELPQVAALRPREEPEVVLLVAPNADPRRVRHKDAPRVWPMAAEAGGQFQRGVGLCEKHAHLPEALLLVGGHAVGPQGATLGAPQRQVGAPEGGADGAGACAAQDLLHLPALFLEAAHRESQPLDIPARFQRRVHDIHAHVVHGGIGNLGDILIHRVGPVRALHGPARVHLRHQRVEEGPEGVVALHIACEGACNLHQRVAGTVHCCFYAAREGHILGGTLGRQLRNGLAQRAAAQHLCGNAGVLGEVWQRKALKAWQGFVPQAGLKREVDPFHLICFVALLVNEVCQKAQIVFGLPLEQLCKHLLEKGLDAALLHVLLRPLCRALAARKALLLGVACSR
mmetsp:Transcript_118444/g.281176  ORF Transcript_118444/g.281176 Transcript_118444/m.281176 type:complete len:360 (-) Transcript_118444:344-1423(-)